MAIASTSSGIFLGTLLIFGAALAPPAQAQAYPDKPIRLIVPFAAGSATDQLARALAVEMAPELKAPAVVENKPGANGMLAAQTAATAAPDGYTVFITTNTTQAANPSLFKTLTYDPVKDFAPVTGLNRNGAQVMLVSPQLQVKNLAEFIALAKSAPKPLTFGHGSSTARVAAELLQQMAGIRMQQVPYKSNVFAITDLLGSQIDMTITDLATGLPQVKAGKLKAIGVSSLTRSSLAPEIPTIDESGLKGYDMSFWSAAYVPARTPPEVVERLREMIAKASSGPAMRSYYQVTGSQPFITTPAELARFQEAEAQKWARIIHGAGIVPE
ncbi:MAG TPA: tripartite tricarboxylate transporter substrate binding protein [Burkholderiales bacterium]|jgi:tripartite-type tricarboxylate transporter receptor subunit TctC|nr:tripartite tricarboxylate transporter substrate binding protein [Burkholderiales bacterium]